MNRNQLRMMAGIPIKVERPSVTEEVRRILLEEPEIRGGTAAPKYATKTDKTVIDSHIKGVRQAILHIKNAIHELSLIPKTDMQDIDHHIQELKDLISSNHGDSGLESLLDMYYDDLRGITTESIVQEAKKKPAKGKITLSVPEKHQLKVARDTLKMSDAGAGVMGGPSKAEAREIIKRLTGKDVKEGIAWIDEHCGCGDEMDAHFTTMPTHSDPEEILQHLQYANAGEEEESSMPADTDHTAGEYGEECEEYEEYEEDSRFKRGQVVSQENGYEWTVIDPDPTEHPGKIYVKCTKSDMTKYLKPGELKVVKENDSTHFDNNLLTFAVLNKPVNVASPDAVDYAPGDDKDETPHQHLDGDIEKEEKIKVPSDVIKGLKDGIETFNKAAERVEGRDVETARFYRTASNAFAQLVDYLSDPTVMHIKRAQIYLTTLMGPILHKVPENVVKFLAYGGQQRSLANYFKEVKAKKG